MTAGAIPTERQVQRDILRMAGLCFPATYIHHSPNGAQLAGNPTSRFKQVGALKGDGFKAGFPDLIVLWAAGKGALLEVKRSKGGVVSPAQKEAHERLAAIGWTVAIVKSVDDAYTYLREQGAPWSGIDPRANPVIDAFHPPRAA